MVQGQRIHLAHPSTHSNETGKCLSCVPTHGMGTISGSSLTGKCSSYAPTHGTGTLTGSRTLCRPRHPRPPPHERMVRAGERDSSLDEFPRADPTYQRLRARPAQPRFQSPALINRVRHDRSDLDPEGRRARESLPSLPNRRLFKTDIAIC